MMFKNNVMRIFNDTNINLKKMGSEKLPLQRIIAEPIPFPADSLGPLKFAVNALHDMVQAPYAMCANSILAAACLAVQGHADIQLPISNKPRPLSCFFLTIGASGERKSAVDSLALKSIVDKEKALKEKYERDISVWKNKYDVWDSERKRILGKTKLAVNAKTTELNQLGPAPEEPIKPLLTFPEPTYQGLHKYLEHGQPNVGVFSAEGGQFIGGHAMRDDNKMETAAGFNALWDGEPLKRVRSGDGTSALYGKRVSMHLMAQPETVQKLVHDRQMEDQGFLARILTCYPASTQGTRFYQEINPEQQGALDVFHQHIIDILDTSPSIGQVLNEPNPRVLPLSAEARELWIKFDTHLETQRSSDGYFSRIAGLANKLPEHAARLAAILALYEDILCQEVSAEHMAAGIQLAQYYAQEALRLKDIQCVSHDLLVAQRALEWLKEKSYRYVPLSDMYQLCPITEIRSAKRARTIMKILSDHGYICFIKGGKEIEGTYRKEVWEVLP